MSTGDDVVVHLAMVYGVWIFERRHTEARGHVGDIVQESIF